MEFLYEYGLFLTKAVTIVVSVAVIIGLFVGAAVKQKQNKKGELVVECLSDEFEDEIDSLRKSMLDKDELKQYEKEQKNKAKKEKKQNKNKEQTKKPKMFVLDFDGDVEASATESLREEITAIVSIAQPGDEVLIKLESPGGLVHGYGLAASQINRLKEKEIKVTAAVDKVAASGGYMMACVADKIVAAPFAILGSIGVVAQLPNVNKLLKKHDVEIEQHTAGEYKRTLTVLGENTDKAREKFKEELEHTHVLFKDFVSKNRSELDIDKVATGEHWYGLQAKELNLIDDIKTSDDLVLESHQTFDVFSVEYKIKHNLVEKLGVVSANTLTKVIGRLSTWSLTNSK